MAGKWLKLDENGYPDSIVTTQPERGVQLVAPNGVEDELAKEHIKAAEQAIKDAKDDAAAAKKTAAK